MAPTWVMTMTTKALVAFREDEPVLRGLATDDGHAYVWQPNKDRMAYVDLTELTTFMESKGCKVVTEDLVGDGKEA